MKKLLSFLQKIENLIMIITFSVMVLASFGQVLNRNIFKMPISWFEEVAVYCMIYMALLGTEIGLRDGSQASITAFTDKLKGNVKKVVDIVARLAVIIFSSAMFYNAVGMFQKQMQTGQTSPALKLPMTVPYFALPLSFGIITVVQTATLIYILLGKNKDKMDGEVQ
ncbi:MAG TPA: TRAP transporter small permease [Clostridiales bacterium]|nr:TRAP transporter small permease [Clostridiales bacterium]